jgi:hypothetical protein
MLTSSIVWVTWIWAGVFVPIETYLSWIHHPFFSEYVVNVLGVGIALWGAHSVRKARPYALGLLATGWGWTTAVFWRGTNLRFWLATRGEPLYFGRLELWLGPVFTLIAGAALSGSLVLLLNLDRHTQSQ